MLFIQEGICGDKNSSTTEILGSLSKAITRYIPIVTMLGNQVRVDKNIHSLRVIIAYILGLCWWIERDNWGFEQSSGEYENFHPKSLVLIIIFFRLILTNWRQNLEQAFQVLNVEHPSQKWQKLWRTLPTSLRLLTQMQFSLDQLLMLNNSKGCYPRLMIEANKISWWSNVFQKF